jgi:hypothetical protein
MGFKISIMKKYLIILITFQLFTSIVYSQDSTLVIVGQKVSVSDIVYNPIVDTLTNFDKIIDTYTKKEVDTIIILRIDDRADNSVNKAIYKVLEVVRGEFKKDVINFTYIDRRHISSSNEILLVFHKWGQNYFLKQQPVEVYKTKDNRWACPYIAEIDKYPQIKLQKLRFKPKLVFDVSMYDDEYIKKHYPSPYYKIKKNKAFAVQGIYAEELNLN